MNKLREIWSSKRARRWVEIGLWLVLIVFVGRRIWPQVAALAGVAAANAAAPRFELTALDGTPVGTDELRGKVVLVNFWATWCPPCRVEMPSFQRTYDAHKDEGFAVVGISMDATGSDDVRRFLADRHIDYPVAMASGKVVQDFGGVALLPTSFLIDKYGRTRYEVRGIFAPVALERAVSHLLAESAPLDTALRALR